MHLRRDRLVSGLIPAIVGVAIGFCAEAVSAVVIDDFTVGPITVIGPDIQTQTGLDPAHVLGGSRAMNVGQFGSGSVLEIDSAGGLEFHSTGRGYFDIQYDFVTAGGGIDLTLGGQDRFRLKFGAIENPSFTPLALYVTLPPTSSSNGVSLYIGDWDDLILEFPFDTFPASMSNVQNLTLDVYRNPTGAELNIKSIATAGPPLSGDYNRDGVVDTDDYSVWRQFFGISTKSNAIFPIASADGNGDGRVDAVDYIVWRNNLTAGSAGASATSFIVPEPATLWGVTSILLLGWLNGVGQRRQTV